MKISDNNIENIYNINIYINGVFSSNIQQDIITVLMGLMNDQSIDVNNGLSLKEQLAELAKQSKDKDLDVNIPVNSLDQSLKFGGLAEKIQKVISEMKDDKSALVPENLEAKAKELLQEYGRDVKL